MSPLPFHVQSAEKRFCFHFGFVPLIWCGSGNPQYSLTHPQGNLQENANKVIPHYSELSIIRGSLFRGDSQITVLCTDEEQEPGPVSR